MAERVLVVGVGPDGRLARRLPDGLALVVGGQRHLDAHAPAGVPARALTGHLEATLDAVAAAAGPVAVLASGDPGWFGIVRRLRARLGADRLEVVPAPSSVSAAFAAVGEPWEDAMVVSAHGRGPTAAIAAGLARPPAAVLTDEVATPAAIARQLLAAGCPPRRVVIAERLGHPDAAVTETDLAGAAASTPAQPNVLLLLPIDDDRAPAATVAGPGVVGGAGRPVSAFAHRDGQVTKPVVRAVALGHLAPAPGRLLWDLGCGSGSLAVEAAAAGAGVVAVDRDPAQVERARANALAHGVSLGTRLGEAVELARELPAPDAVFIGGGGPALPALLDQATDRARDRIAVAIATVERVGPARQRLADAGWTTAAQWLSVAELAPLGDGHRLAPHNPVALVLAERP